MKDRRFALFLILIILIGLFGAGCKAGPYPYDQSLDNVVGVAICRYDYDLEEVQVIKELEPEPGKRLLTEIGALDTYRHFGDHPTTCGEIVIHVSYSDGTGEVIGAINTARVTLSGKWLIKLYGFENSQWANVVLKYIDLDQAPELEHYLIG